MKASKQLRSETPRRAVPQPRTADIEVDIVRFAGDVAAFESATGVPHDPIAIGLFLVVGGFMRGIVSAVRRLGVAVLRR